ncbi:uncharacterized protein LOC144652611 [Oculina patagonica]
MSDKAKKNKRGDRGSLDDENIEPKRQQTEEALNDMAANTEATWASDKEPTLTEIKDILVGLQKSVSKILIENQSLKEELSHLRASVNSQGRDFDKVKVTLDRVTKENQSLKVQLHHTTEKLNKQVEETDKLWFSHDDLEQYSRKNSLEIDGVPEECYTSTEEVVLKVGNALNVEISPQDIEISHRINRRGSKPILVKFISHKVKTRLYKERVKLKNVNLKDLFPSYASAARGESTRIFINENLTNYRRFLVGTANKMKRDGIFVSVWTIDGKIFAKTSPDGSPIKIRCEEDLEAI